MDELHRSDMESRWVQALGVGSAMAVSPPGVRRVLGALLGELATELESDPFDVVTSVRVGYRLADLGFSGPGVPTLAAYVLSELAEDSDHTDAASRMAVLLAGVAEGFHARADPAAEASSARGAGGAVHRPVADDRFQSVFDKVAVGIAIADIEGTLVEVNPYLADMVGIPVEELRGNSIYRFAHRDDVEAIHATVFDELVPERKGTVRSERRMVRADGSVGWVAFSITYVHGANGRADSLLAVVEDVTERHQLREELDWQARHDPLTRLPNRRYLLEQLDSLGSGARSADRVGLCFIDVDGFKEINDRYGHRIGDQVLLTIATRMSDKLAAHNGLIARIGGDEFVVLVPPPADDRGVREIAEAVLSAQDDTITVDDHRIPISASVGAVVAEVSGIAAEELLDAADRELYRAKKGGKGRWILHVLDPRTD